MMAKNKSINRDSQDSYEDEESGEDYNEKNGTCNI